MDERRTDEDWIKVAQQNPYWGVLSVPEFLGADLDPAAKQRFFESGETHVTDMLHRVRTHLYPGFAPRRTLDFGCGVGRLLFPLARRSEQAVGVDIAPPMLALARANAAAMQVENFELVLADDQLSGVTGGFDLVNSYIVLQHIPPQRGYGLLRRLIGLINPGGIGAVQLTYGKSRRVMEHEAPRALYYRRDGNYLVDLLATDAGPPEGTILMYDYDLNQVFALLKDVVTGHILTYPTGDADHLGVDLLFRKAGG